MNTPCLLFTGDVMLGENVYHIGRGIRTKFSDDYSKMIPDSIKTQIFDGVDAVVYNFEYSLTNENFKFDDFEKSVYAAPINSLDVFPNNILKIVNIANNHFWEKGVEQTQFTIDTLKKKGFIVIGENEQPVVVNIKDKRFFFWGVSLIDWSVPIFTSTYNNLLDNIILPQKEQGDVWIMSVHWGTEFINQPDQPQIDLAYRLVNAGFDIVHGHHPHVFQPVKLFKDSLIFYSLGNCLFDENFANDTQLSYMPRVKFGNKIEWRMYRMKNRHYAPIKLEEIPCQDVLYKNKVITSFRKSIISKKYNLLRKLEFLPHIAQNNFYIYKSMKKRYKLMKKREEE